MKIDNWLKEFVEKLGLVKKAITYHLFIFLHQFHLLISLPFDESGLSYRAAQAHHHRKECPAHQPEL